MQTVLKRNHITADLSNKMDMQQCIAKTQRNRMLVCWHDHAKILGTGYLLITINTVYDTALFMTEQQYTEKNGQYVSNIQAIVEKPHVYIIAAGSSSAEDQAAVISGGFRGGSEVSMEPPFLAKSKIDCYTKATVVG